MRTENAIAAVEESIEKDPIEAIRHRAQQSEFRPFTLLKILRKGFDLRAYEIHRVARSVNGLKMKWPTIQIFTTKVCLAHFWLTG